jgi:ubiquitin-protein ligase
MTDNITCQIDVPDGRRFMISFPPTMVPADNNTAPAWLVSQVTGSAQHITNWRLRFIPPLPDDACGVVDLPRQSQSPPRFCLVGAFVAGSPTRPFDPRQARLKKERLALEKLNAESDHVRVTPINVVDGSEPERYRITFSCRGISDIDASKNPIYSDLHEVLIICDDSFPSDVPKLRWETPIWHPNIQHIEPKAVCVNKPEWLGGMGLDDLVRLMFEMVQYKNYHAVTGSKPYPLDEDVAKWVREYAEPAGIVDKSRNISVDDRPFTRPTVDAVRRIKIGLVKKSEPLVPRIKFLGSAMDRPVTSSPSTIKIKKLE